ncbi:MAG TPA: diguanylate cyclase [Gammaproteobacteria bacterium]|mgnify:CR=1 FL=1|nr:diguanylate cyclase [Xanthomonadales bacterium]HOP21691.1 diguanylate cyclase [Gammaproteobacteria bacterium]HPI95602.1 diguanylate cyclase [Gammaproteobacteria bacterium]HPQ86815.1 diguanylate cyclase [Gammaproteobacteria bacterium]
MAIKRNVFFKLIIIGVFGAILNLLKVNFFLYEINLVLASTLVYIIAVYRDVKSTFLVGVISSITLIDSNWEYWLFFLYTLNALCISYIYRKYISNLLVSTLIFWFLIGIPLSMILGRSVDNLFENQNHLFYIQLIFIALINVVFASIIISNRWGHDYIASDKNILNITLQKTYALHLSIIFLFITLITSGVLLKIEINEACRDQKNQRLALYNDIKNELNIKITANMMAISEIANGLTYLWDNPQERKSFLENSQNRLNFFNILVVSDESGNLLNISKPEYLTNIAKENLASIDDRAYFKEAMKTDTAYISNGFKGRGIGTNNIAVISHSIPSIGGDHKVGIIHGSILLDKIPEIKRHLNKSSINKGILLDQNNNILFASDTLKLKTLEPFSFTRIGKQNKENDLTRINLGDDKNYFYWDEKLDWGWRLVLIEHDEYFIGKITRYITLFSIIVIFIVILAEIVSVIMSKYWTARLNDISNVIKNIGLYENVLSNTDVEILPQELRTIYQSIEDTNKEIKLVKQNLHDSLSSKDELYQHATMQLKDLQTKDYLTGFDNRETFNRKLSQIWQEKKNNYQALSIIVLAIDDFRGINSQRGEIFGDNLLAQLSKKLLEISEYVCIARIGGNKFALINELNSHYETVQFAEDIKSKVATMQIVSSGDNVYSIFHPSISIGVVSVDPYKSQLDDFLIMMNQVLEQSIHSGGDCVNSINKSILI